MVDSAFLITGFVTLFVIMDPIGLTPVFIALAQGMSPRKRLGIAARGCVVAGILLCLFSVFGEALLEFVGISMPAFRIAGGLLLFLTALDMLFQRRQKRREDQAGEEDLGEDPSVFPLAMPLIAGPGSIATMILLSSQQSDVLGFLAVMGIMVSVLVITFLLFLSSSVLEKALGATGINVVTRLLGMLLAALSVQFVLDGLKAFGFA